MSSWRSCCRSRSGSAPRSRPMGTRDYPGNFGSLCHHQAGSCPRRMGIPASRTYPPQLGSQAVTSHSRRSLREHRFHLGKWYRCFCSRRQRLGRIHLRGSHHRCHRQYRCCLACMRRYGDPMALGTRSLRGTSGSKSYRRRSSSRLRKYRRRRGIREVPL